MAAQMFDLDAQAQCRATRLVDVGLDAIANAIKSLPDKAAVSELTRAQRRLAGLEADLLSRHVTAGGNSRGAESLLGDGKTSRREARKRAKRARANKNSSGQLSDKLESGEMSEEQVDIIADADAKSEGEASKDQELIDAVGNADPDRGRTITDQWLADRKDKDGVESEHQRQRRLRRMNTYLSKRHSLDVIAFEGDSVTQKLILEALKARADEIYRRDGGRDLGLGEHPRTRQQRDFDAFAEMILGVQVDPAGNISPDQVSDSSTDSEQAGRSGCKGGDGCRARESVRARVIVGLTLDKFLGIDNKSLASQVGLGLIPDSVLANYLEYGEIIGALFDHNGEQLWQGRLKRHATSGQFLALSYRDKGCVLCKAPHSQCQAHHLMPWEAPGKGQTDIDQMALLCSPCHHKLHADNHTLYRIAPGHWDTRPATAHETPPRPAGDHTDPMGSRRGSGRPGPGRGGSRNQV